MFEASVTAPLSPRAKHVLSIDADTAYTTLVPGKAGSAEARDGLELLKPSDVLAAPGADRDAAAAALAGLWLWHDFLHESHELSQSVETPTGSYWHAIMHRREGDFSNAKYWYRRVGNHLAMPSIAARVDVLTQSLPSDKAIFRLTAGGWRPEAFVDLVEAVNADPNDARRQLAIDIGKIEWQTLFETTLREA
jgi:hypothetical protein